MWKEVYEYDENNNRISKANGWGRIEDSYNGANEIESAGKRRYEHDKNGNLTKEILGSREVSYSYNSENRIVRIKGDLIGIGNKWKEGREISYSYDVFGRRKGRIDGFGGERYLYDGLGFEVKEEIGKIGVKGRPGKRGKIPFTLREYVYVNGKLLSESDYRGRRNNYYHQDILGSTVMVTDGRGKVRESYSYDAYGNIYGDFPYINMGYGKPKLSRYLYDGKPYEPAVGLYNYGFRDYKPMLGRWTTVDPIRAGLNWYVYVGNDPVNRIDPLGLMPDKPLYSISINLNAKLPSSPKKKTEPLFAVTGEEWERAEKLSHLNDPAYMAEKIGDLATYGALGLNVANLGATITGNIPAAETFGAAAGVLDIAALGAYTIAGKSNKAMFAAFSLFVDIVPGLAAPLKPAYNLIAKRFISASTGRFIKNWAGVTKYSLSPTTNTGIGLYEILGLETGESNK